MSALSVLARPGVSPLTGGPAVIRPSVGREFALQTMTPASTRYTAPVT